MSESKTITLDGDEYRVTKTDDGAEIDQVYERTDIFGGQGATGSYVSEFDHVNWDAYYDVAEQEDTAVAKMLVTPHLLQDWAETVHLATADPVELTMADELPLLADVGGGEIIALAPRVRR